MVYRLPVAISYLRVRQGISGQSSIQLVAIVPAFLLLALVAGQLVVTAYALWSAGIAARAGARAEHVGGAADDVALRALPVSLRRGATVQEDGSGVMVRVRAPSIVPGLPAITLATRTALDPEAGDR